MEVIWKYSLKAIFGEFAFSNEILSSLPNHKDWLVLPFRFFLHGIIFWSLDNTIPIIKNDLALM